MIARTRPRGRDGGSGDRGAATVWVLLAMTVVWSVTTWGIALASVAAVRSRAASAADLAALAAASQAWLGEPAACAGAREIATANRARLADCTVDAVARTAVVLVEVRGGGLLAHAAPSYARARAGPGDGGDHGGGHGESSHGESDHGQRDAVRLAPGEGGAQGR